MDMDIMTTEQLIGILVEDISAPLLTHTRGRQRITRVVQGSDKSILQRSSRETPMIAWARSLRTAVIVYKVHNVHSYYLQADDINMGFRKERPCAVTATEMNYGRAKDYIREAVRHPLITVSRSAAEALDGLDDTIRRAQPRVMAEFDVVFWTQEIEASGPGVKGTMKTAGVFNYRFVEKNGGSVIAEGKRWQPLVDHYYGWKPVNFDMAFRRYEWATGVDPTEQIPARTNRDPEKYLESVSIRQGLSDDDYRSVRNNMMINKL